MSPTWTFFCLLVSFGSFVVAATPWRRVADIRLNIVAAGLALWLLPALWAAQQAIN